MTAAIDLRSLYGPNGPHKFQLEAHTSRARTKCLKWARRAGKGRCAVNCLIDTFFELSESPRASHLVPQFHAMFVAPFSKNADQAWMELKEYVPDFLIRNNGIKEDERKIWLVGFGSIRSGLIEFRTADNPASLQGAGLDFAWTTESQDIPLQAYSNLRPMLRSPDRAGRLFAEGVPPVFPDHWFNKVFEMGETGVPGYFSSRITYLDNPMMTEDDRRDIETDRAVMSEQEWNRMYMAEDPSSLEIPLNIEAVMTGRVNWEKQKPQEGRIYVAGLDLGKKASATVLTIWDRTDMPWKMVYFRRMASHEDWMVQKAVIVQAVNDEWMVDKVYIDAQGPGDPIYDEFRYMGMPLQAVPIQGNTRENILNKLAIAVEKRAIQIPREDAIIRECRAMRREKVSDLTVRWKTRDGYQNDTVFSMALGISDLPLRDGPVMQRRPPDYYGYFRMTA